MISYLESEVSMKNLEDYILKFGEKNLTSNGDVVSHPIFGLITTKGIVASTNFNVIREVCELIHTKKIELSICDSFESFEEMADSDLFEEFRAIANGNMLFAECIVSGRGIDRYVEDKYMAFGRGKEFLIGMLGVCRNAYIAKYSPDNDIRQVDTKLMKLVIDLRVDETNIYSNTTFESKNTILNIERLTGEVVDFLLARDETLEELKRNVDTNTGEAGDES